MLRISSRCFVAFSPSSEIRALKRSGLINHPRFEIEFQFHVNPSSLACQRQRKTFLSVAGGEQRPYLQNAGRPDLLISDEWEMGMAGKMNLAMPRA